MRALLLVPLLAACTEPAPALHITTATPAYAPVVGGTTVRLAGSGFAAPGAGPNRILVGGREAPVARTIDDATIEVVVPPADQPGDAEVVVLSGERNARATGILRYSTPPEITAVTPGEVVFSATDVPVTLTGSGFLDDGAGVVHVVVDGQLATDVVVTTDSSLTFVSPPGPALVRPDIVVINERGSTTRRRGYRYVPSKRPGLLLFSVGAEFALFFDPADRSIVSIPRATTITTRFTAVVRDELGDYWGADRSRQFGAIDMRTQRIENPPPVQAWFPALTRIGGEYFGLNRGTLQFGALDPTTAVFTNLGAEPIACCGSYGIASDGTTLYMTSRPSGLPTLRAIDPVTGVAGPPVLLSGVPGFSVEEMRFFAGTLYAANRGGSLFTIDPSTGVVTAVPEVLGRFTAMEVFEPLGSAP